MRSVVPSYRTITIVTITLILLILAWNIMTSKFPYKIKRTPYTSLSTLPPNTVQTTIVPYDPAMEGGSYTKPLADDQLQFGKAFEGSIQTTTAPPKFIPVPTSMTIGTYPTTLSNQPTNVPSDMVATGQPAPADLNSNTKPVDAIMSQWTQWGPCTLGLTMRTRTCIHNQINGGNPCAHTIETQTCTN